MATLFDYVKELDELLALATDEDGVIDEEVFGASIAALEMEKEAKIDNCIAFIKSKRALANALKNEKMVIAKRQAAADNAADRTAEYLAFCLDGAKWDSTAGKVSYRKSESVEVADDFHDERFIKYEPKISKSEIKDALKAGEIIEGALLVEKTNIQVK